MTVLLLVLLPALAVLQYRWVGQVSIAESERMQRNVRTAADQFRETFDLEVFRAVTALQVGVNTARDGASDGYSERYNGWLSTAAYPQIVANVFVVDRDAGALRLRQWNAETHALEPAVWQGAIASWQLDFAQELATFNAGRPPDRRASFRNQESLILQPLRNFSGPRRGVPPDQVFGFTVLQLDMPYLRGQMIPALADRHFIHEDGDNFRVAVTAGDDSGRVLYESDTDQPVAVAAADATAPLLGASFRTAIQRVYGPFGFGFGRGRGLDGPGDDRGDDEDVGRWRLAVQHQSGSLEAAVGLVRRRNLGISFGVLLLLSVSVGLLTATSRKAERLAQQQMEFVAGVSHELRTPVAVIRSAAENLAQGVVNGDRVKRYGQMLEGEARRLGEMVERVLQFAGIESGLGFGARAPLAPAEIVESAIEGAIPLVGPGDVHVQRDIAADLPPVVGDAAALRSAVQNLIANAVKYGGGDRWVGVRAQHVHERRRSEVRITVSDHGAGIPASELPHIFEPFYRGADAIERQIHGNGLGLSLVKRIVTAHDGRVTVTTRAGAGSSFTIALPVAEAAARETQVADGMQVGAHS